MNETIQMNILLISILFCGWLVGKLFTKFKLPSVLGMTIYGILISIFSRGNYPDVFIGIKPVLTSLALIIILLRAGLGIKRSTLHKVGIQAILMSFIPCIIEGSALTVMFHYFYNFEWAISGVTGFLIAAVSPAIVVPSMLLFKEKGLGKKNDIPTLILAGASLDDVFAITIFTIFLNFAMGNSTNIAATALKIPVSILGGISLGIMAAILFLFILKLSTKSIRDTEKSLLLLVFALSVYVIGEITHFAGLLAVMTMGFIILERENNIANRMAAKMGKMWIFAEIILFVIIGMSVDISVIFNAGGKAILIILCGLIFRSAGVFISLIGSKLSFKEKLFCAFAYTPKATVQAAMGSVPLAMGIEHGETILAIAVLAIIVTAPLGLILIRNFGPKLLSEEIT